jgi:hypothetical protein
LENNFTCYDATMAMTGMISEIAKINRLVNTVDKAAARFYLKSFLEGLHIYGSKRNSKIEKYFGGPTLRLLELSKQNIFEYQDERKSRKVSNQSVQRDCV